MLPIVRENFHYEPLGEIGFGSHSTIYKGRDRSNGTMVAIKKITILLAMKGMPASTLREIAVLKALSQQQHPNIIRLLDVVHGPRASIADNLVIYMIFEHIEQDLATYIANCPKPGLSCGTIKSIMKQILSGVDFLQSNRVIHRHLKPQNILVSSDLRIKITDFGFSKIYDLQMPLTSFVATLWYQSPEILLHIPYSTAIDVWSCGCIMAELYLSAPLFPGQSEIEQLNKIFSVIGLPSEEKWPADNPILWSSFEPYLPISFKTIIPQICSNGEDLMKKLLELDDSTRASAFSALQHPYFDGIDV